MRLLLTRHGRTASNVAALLDTAPPGPDLDLVGRAQAVALSGRVTGQRIGGVYSSDLVRAVQTAEPVAEAFGVTATVLPGLREIPGGHYEMTADVRDYVAVLRSWGEGDRAARVPGGESGEEFLHRFDSAIRRIAEDGVAGALVVSHGAAMRAWSSHARPEVHAVLGHRGMPNTTVIVADGDPDDGWRLLGIDFPEVDPDDGFAKPSLYQEISAQPRGSELGDPGSRPG